MFAAQKALKISQATGRFVIPSRTVAVTTPPRVRISFAEKAAHGMMIFIGIMATPVYIAVNIKNYRQ